MKMKMPKRTKRTFLNYATCKALGDFVAEDESRPVLNRAHVTADYVEATNGHIAIRIGLSPGLETDKQFVLDASVFKQVKKGRVLAIDPEAGGDVWIGGGPACLREDAEFLIPGALSIDSKYPKMDAVLPVEDEHDRAVAFDGDYLKRLGQVVKRFGIRSNRITFRIPPYREDEDCVVDAVAFRIDVPSDNGNGVVTGAIMPMRVLEYE